MSYFEYRLPGENIWVVVERVDGSGEYTVSVFDVQRREIEDVRDRTRAIVAALREESKRRTALWKALPEDARRAIREERA